MALVALGEDDEDFRWLLESTLSKAGIDVRATGRGDELLALVTTAVPTPHLVLTDVRMPGMLGTDVLRAVRRAGLEMPIVLMTAFEDAVDEEEARALGADRLLSKPFDLAELRLVLSELLPGSVDVRRGRIVRRGRPPRGESPRRAG